MPEGDYDAIGRSGCVLSGAAGIVVGIVLLLAAIIALTSCATALPAPAPLPARVEIVREYVPVYDACPRPPYLPRPDYRQWLLDALASSDLEIKWLAIEYAFRSAIEYGDDEAVLLDAYRGAATHPPAPTPTPGP